MQGNNSFKELFRVEIIPSRNYFNSKANGGEGQESATIWEENPVSEELLWAALFHQLSLPREESAQRRVSSLFSAKVHQKIAHPMSLKTTTASSQTAEPSPGTGVTGAASLVTLPVHPVLTDDPLRDLLLEKGSGEMSRRPCCLCDRKAGFQRPETAALQTVSGGCTLRPCFPGQKAAADRVFEGRKTVAFLACAACCLTAFLPCWGIVLYSHLGHASPF